MTQDTTDVKNWRLSPKLVLWSGLGLVGAAVALDVVYLPVTYHWQTLGSTGIDRALLTALVSVLGVAKTHAPGIGAALIGASVVMFHLESRAGRRPPSE